MQMLTCTVVWSDRAWGTAVQVCSESHWCHTAVVCHAWHPEIHAGELNPYIRQETDWAPAVHQQQFSSMLAASLKTYLSQKRTHEDPQNGFKSIYILLNTQAEILTAKYHTEWQHWINKPELLVCEQTAKRTLHKLNKDFYIFWSKSMQKLLTQCYGILAWLCLWYVVCR